MTGKAGLQDLIAGLTACLLLFLSGCNGPGRAASLDGELAAVLADYPRLSEMPWEDIRTVGLPLATRQAITEKCFGTSQGEFSNFLHDLKTVSVPEELIEDIREAGDYMASNVTCDEDIVRLSGEAAMQAQKLWRERMKLEYTIQAKEQ